MPGFKIVTQYPDVETDGGQVVRNVIVVGTLTNDHQVYFERRYPKKTFAQSVAVADSRGFTIVFEDLFTIPNVDAVTWGQQLNSANQLVDIVTVYYTSTSGDSSSFVATPFAMFTHDIIAGEVAAGVAVLDAHEAAQ